LFESNDIAPHARQGRRQCHWSRPNGGDRSFRTTASQPSMLTRKPAFRRLATPQMTGPD